MSTTPTPCFVAPQPPSRTARPAQPVQVAQGAAGGALGHEIGAGVPFAAPEPPLPVFR